MSAPTTLIGESTASGFKNATMSANPGTVDSTLAWMVLPLTGLYKSKLNEEVVALTSAFNKKPSKLTS